MLYVEQSFGKDEELIHVGEFHWMYTVHAFTAIIWGIAAAILLLKGAVFMNIQIGKFPDGVAFMTGIQYIHPGLKALAFVAFLLGLLSFARMMVLKATTEIAVTNKRLIYKRGLIARSIIEISVDRIEGVNVLQTIFGRLFGYGRIMVRGMGVGEVVLPPVEDPVLFRKSIQKARDHE